MHLPSCGGRSRRRRALSALLVAVALGAGACSGSGGAGVRRPAPSPATSDPDRPLAVEGDGGAGAERPRGGSARVGVWAAPDVAAPTLGGAAVRALVLPQLFVAGPDGRWEASLAEPGSDATAPDARSATLRLRAGAAWSDGAPVTAADLRRSADGRFVSGIDGPAPDGTLTLRFAQPLPGWRRLWSGLDSVAAPAPGVWGGPFAVASARPGLETVLRRNDAWRGGPGPFLDEVVLVLVPDAVTARQLLERGELDVVMPPAATARTAQLRRLPGVALEAREEGGWWVGLWLEPERMGDGARRGLVATVDRRPFVDTLLHGEATVLDGLAGPEDATWAAAADPGPSPKGWRGGVDLVGELEQPLTPLLQRAMQKRARPSGAALELRNAEADRVEAWRAERSYDAAIATSYDGPEVCWSCRFGAVDAALARSADAGDAAATALLEAKLRDEALLLPLWRPRTVVAWRTGLEGVAANGYALSGAWNAWRWWRRPAAG